MNGTVSRFLGQLELGDAVADGGLTIVPVFGQFTGVPEFVTLEEAIAAHWLVVTEVSEGGSVPMLQAKNTGPLGVIILDGEELAGAKQNRVLNTSVFIKAGQGIVIPVSCTEAGRWSYSSRVFGDSGHMSGPGIRVAAAESVTDSLRARRGHHSDQGRIWKEVSLLQHRHKMQSPTSAARDVYENQKESLRRREAAFACLPGQVGLLVLWSGRVAGLDVVASGNAYARLHGRLIRSYAIDAPPGSPSSSEADRTTAQRWLAALASIDVTEHESPGNGIDYRFSGPGVVGSALAVDGAVLHAVAFATQTDPSSPGLEEGRYPGFYERRSHFPW